LYRGKPAERFHRSPSVRASIAILSLALLFVAGCTDRQRDDAIDQGARIGKQAANKVADVASQAWKSALDRASKLDAHSATEALSNAKDSMEHAVADLKPGERLDAAKAEIERLRAAIDLQKLQKEADEKITQAQELKENAGKTVDDVKAKLDAADKAYRDLQEKLDSAQQMYDTAAKKAQDAREAIAHLTS